MFKPDNADRNFHIRTVQQLVDIIEVLFIHQLMH